MGNNKEFLDNISLQMVELARQRDDCLEKLNSFPISNQLKKGCREEIMKNFYTEMENFKGETGQYQEAIQSARHELYTKGRLRKVINLENKLKSQGKQGGVKRKKTRNLERKLWREYIEAQVAHRGKVEIFSGARLMDIKEYLEGNKNAILEYLKQNCIKKEETIQNITKYGENKEIKGFNVHVVLPKVGKFGGFEFDYFATEEYCYISKVDIENDSELESKLFSKKEISEVLQAINKFMGEFGVYTDGNVDYENAPYWYKNNFEYGENCFVSGDCLQQITNLNGDYLLNSKETDRSDKVYDIFCCRKNTFEHKDTNDCFFRKAGHKYDLFSLLTKLSN